MSPTPQPKREPVTRCRALCKMQGKGSFKRDERCELNAMPGGELCWTHTHAANNPKRSEPLELAT